MNFMSDRIKIALVQMDVGPCRENNLMRAEKLLARAARRGADIICLPELFSGSFTKPRETAEDVNGPSLSMVKTAAKRHGVFIVAGSILERTRRGLPLNTCFLVGPDGKIRARYSKLHLFDIRIPGKIIFEESKSMRPGGHVTVAKTPFGKIGFAICNDLRYPEIFRKMSLAGAEIIFVAAAFTKFTGRNHWLALNRVRAVENLCYIAAVNQSGKNSDGVRFFGSSVVINPWGKILKEGPSKGDALIMCEIDLGKIVRVRKQLPALKKIRKRYRLRAFRGKNTGLRR